MQTTYVCGHRNPDTDSIVSAMAYARLMNALGDNDYVAARLGHLNDESTFLLKKFDFTPPLFLHTVRTQVKDIDFDRPPLLGTRVPVSYAWEVLESKTDNHAAPIIREDGSLYGLITASSIANSDMESIRHPYIEHVPSERSDPHQRWHLTILLAGQG